MGHEATDTNTTTGCGLVRWHSERRATMQIINEYVKLKYGHESYSHESVKAVSKRLTWAGHEPLEFTNMFLWWIENEEVKSLNGQVRGQLGMQSIFFISPIF